MEILSIYIPTRNRSSLLKELLTEFYQQIENNKISSNDLMIYISDNASTDDTEKIVNNFINLLPNMIIYHRNKENIGVKENIFNYYHLTHGKYCWIHSDDELIEKDTLPYIIDILKKQELNLLINISNNNMPEYKLPIFFKNYFIFLKEVSKIHPHIILAHTHLTLNIFRKDCLDIRYARKKADTSYGQMYGLLYALKKTNGAVFLVEKTTTIIREKRAKPDKESVEKKLYFDYDNLFKHWLIYLNWIKRYYNLKEIDIQKIINFQMTGNYEYFFKINKDYLILLRNFIMGLPIIGGILRHVKRIYSKN